MAATAGTEKVSSGPSESEGSSSGESSAVSSSGLASSSGPVSSGGSAPPGGSSGPVDCVCEVQAVHLNTEHEGESYQANCYLAAAGTCNVTITAFTTSYGGVEGTDYVFSGTPFDMAAGTERAFAYNRVGSPSGDEIFIHFICENGHEDVVGFTIP